MSADHCRRNLGSTGKRTRASAQIDSSGVDVVAYER
jgi:hypothetical protein